jgi:putative membrane protein
MLAIPNAISFLFLLAAIYFARKKQIRAHKTMVFCCMLISLVLVYLFAEMRLQGESLIDKERMASFSLGFKLFLASHIIAATITFILSVIVCTLGFKEVKKKWHKKIAYFMAPIWAYSSISGVIVFVLAGSPNQPPKQTKEKHHFLLNY